MATTRARWRASTRRKSARRWEFRSACGSSPCWPSGAGRATRRSSAVVSGSRGRYSGTPTRKTRGAAERNMELTLMASRAQEGAGTGAKKRGGARPRSPGPGGKQDPAWSAYLAAVIESSDDAIITKNLDGVITSWNLAAERIFGYTAKEAVGRHITMIIPEDRRSEENGILKRLRRGERIEHFETIRQAKDGRLLNISITVSPVKDDAGKIIGASKIARDITDRILHQDRLKFL